MNSVVSCGLIDVITCAYRRLPFLKHAPKHTHCNPVHASMSGWLWFRQDAAQMVPNMHCMPKVMAAEVVYSAQFPGCNSSMQVQPQHLVLYITRSTGDGAQQLPACF